MILKHRCPVSLLQQPKIGVLEAGGALFPSGHNNNVLEGWVLWEASETTASGIDRLGGTAHKRLPRH